MNDPEKKFYVYWIVSGRFNYIGATIDPIKRLRQHNCEIVGGARYTRGKLWNFKCVLSGFREWTEALKFEWSFKYHSKRCRSIESRKRALESVMNKTRWTSNSPLATDVPLTVEFDPIQYGTPPDTLPSPKPRKAVRKKKTLKASEKTSPTKAKRKWKKKLLGVKY